MSNEELNQNNPEQTENTNQNQDKPENPAPENPDVNSTLNPQPEEQKPAEEPVAPPTPVYHASAPQEEGEAKPAKEPQDTSKFNEVFEELKQIKEQNAKLTVNIKARIRGGLRATYKEMPIFLPASHFALKRNPAEEELNEFVGKDIDVKVHELQEEEGRKTVIVSRRAILESEFWDTIKVGDIVEGTVSSIATFGIFLDLGGVEGLIHVSRLSQTRVDDPKKIAKKGERMRAVVVEVDKAANRIALSRKELEESPWKGVEEQFPAGSKVKGTVRRITDFGAYIELKPGIDGLLRTAELSWTKRIKSPNELLKPGQEVEVYIISANEDKQTVSLSLKRLSDNPWEGLKEKYPEGTQLVGKAIQVLPAGILVSVGEEIDGFMPRSKMRAKGRKAPYNVGEEIEIVVVDVIPEQETLIVAPANQEEGEEQHYEREPRERRDDRGPRKPRRDDRGPRKPQEQQQSGSESSGSFSFADLLSDKAKKNLNKAAGDEGKE